MKNLAIGTASRQIVAGNMYLSSRTEGQASSLEQIAAASMQDQSAQLSRVVGVFKLGQSVGTRARLPATVQQVGAVSA